MDLSTLRTALGLGADVPDAEVLTQAAAKLAPPEPVGEATTPPAAVPQVVTQPSTQVVTPPVPSAVTTTTPPVTGQEDTTAPPATDETPVPKPERTLVNAAQPAGTVQVDAALWEQVRRGAETATTMAAQFRKEARDRFIGEVAASGRLSPANAELREDLEKAWDRSPDEAQRIAANLAVVFATSALGHDGPGDAQSVMASWDAADNLLWPELAEIRSNGQGGK